MVWGANTLKILNRCAFQNSQGLIIDKLQINDDTHGKVMFGINVKQGSCPMHLTLMTFNHTWTSSIDITCVYLMFI